MSARRGQEEVAAAAAAAAGGGKQGEEAGHLKAEADPTLKAAAEEAAAPSAKVSRSLHALGAET